MGGQPRGQVVKFVCSAAAAQGFAGSDPGHKHGTARQATLRQHPTCHKQKEPELKNIQLCTGGIWGEKAEKKKKEDQQQLLDQVPIFKKINK